jgi:hypothetical protein
MEFRYVMGLNLQDFNSRNGSFVTKPFFPTDASIYLFLWDPKSPEEKGIDMPIE